MPTQRRTLRDVVATLLEHHGPPKRPPTADPFELVLLENIAYLAPAARREEAFEELRERVGTTPAAVATAGTKALEKVTARGILKSTFAAKLRECGHIALEELDGDLASLIRGPLGPAKRALRSFPGIGEPGAEKILLFAGREALLAPDSNGLRVLVRLGLVQEDKSYSRTYAAAREAASALPADPRSMQEAHLLLQKHGQTLCKRTAPRCGECPLAPDCAYASREAKGSKRGHA